jgi:small GTP-binding protein
VDEISQNVLIDNESDDESTEEEDVKTPSNPYFSFKLIMIGDGGVGKTALLKRFTQDSFDSAYRPTIGIDFSIKYLSINNNPVKLEIWDTAGQARYQNNEGIYDGAHGAIVVCDLTNQDSFQSVKSHVEKVRKECKDDNIPIILVGAKTDLLSRAVTVQQLRALGDELGCSVIEASSNTGEQVENIFKTLAANILNLFLNNDDSGPRKEPEQNKTTREEYLVSLEGQTKYAAMSVYLDRIWNNPKYTNEIQKIHAILLDYVKHGSCFQGLYSWTRNHMRDVLPIIETIENNNLTIDDIKEELNSIKSHLVNDKGSLSLIINYLEKDVHDMNAGFSGNEKGCVFEQMFNKEALRFR